MNDVNQKEKVKIGRILAFSAPSLPLAALGLPVVIQLPHHYVSYVGLSLSVVGTMFMIARLFDVFIDLGLGMIMDKTKTKIGRFTPWLLVGAPLMAICVYFLFMAKQGSSPLYLCVALIGTYICFSMGMLAQLGVGASLSSNYYERSRIFSFWQIGNIIGMLMVLALPVIVSKMGGSDAQGVHAMGWFIIIAMPICAVISWIFAKEDVNSKPVKHTNIHDFFALFKLKAFRLLMLSDLTMSFGMGVTGGLFLFFLSNIKGYGALSSALLLIYFVVGLIFTPLWVYIAKKLGKHWAFAIAAIYTIFSQALVYLMPKGDFIMAAIFMALAGIVYAGPILLIRAMVGDSGDQDKLINKEDRTGLLFACMTLTSKLGYALSVGITYSLLDRFGFNDALGVNNSQFSLNALQYIYFGFPIVANLILIFLMSIYPLSAKNVEQIQNELEQKETA